MKRFSSKRLGYDCIRKPCGERGCGTNPGSGHGIHCETWYYAVSDGTVALLLEVWSGIFPDTVPPEQQGDDRYPHGSWLTVHTAFAVGDEGRETIRSGAKGRECEYLDGGLCFDGGDWVTQGEELFEKIGAAHSDTALPAITKQQRPGQPRAGRLIATFEQPESFWLGMEKAWVEFAKPVYDERADVYERCKHCDGVGTVLRKP